MKQLIILLILLLTSCTPTPKEVINCLLNSDNTLPQLLNIKSISENKVEFIFSEQVQVLSYQSGDNKVTNCIKNGNKLQLIFKENLPITHEYPIHLAVQDKAQNTLSLAVGIRGKNTNIPELVINEFLSRGTETQPNRIELEARSSGNLSGLCIRNAVTNYESICYSFPNLEIIKGQYIVIYINSSPNSEVRKLLESKNVIILEAKLKEGFPQANGMCLLYDTPLGEGTVLDALVYISNTATTFSKFGKAELEKSYNYLIKEGYWTGEPINSEKATSTRTICRRAQNDYDTNSAFDFYIAETRTSSFGEQNTNIEYQP